MTEPVPQLGPDELRRRLADRGYLADRPLATVVSIALALQKPLLLEGEAGVGKTALATALAECLGARLIRLQCYEGIDVAHTLYDWNYARQMLYIRTIEATGDAAEHGVDELFGREFLVRRPLLDAIEHDDPVAPVLLIDEIDRADDEFEAFLLELLADFQLTIPEIGTIAAEVPPVAILTSNRTREIHDALKRRCLYHWIDHPTPAREVEIIRARIKDVPDRLARQAATLVAQVRELGLVKAPGVSETLDWVAAMIALGQTELDPEQVEATLGALLKHQEDIARVRREGIESLVAAAQRDGA